MFCVKIRTSAYAHTYNNDRPVELWQEIQIARQTLTVFRALMN